MNKVIYFDNNATTKLCDLSKKAICDWLQRCSNPSGSTFVSGAGQILLDNARKYIATKICNTTTDDYKIIFTSSASESNSFIIKSIVDAWYRRLIEEKSSLTKIPHIVSSAIEHHSVLECLEQLVKLKRLEVTLVNPLPNGMIDPESVKKAIKSNTCLVTIMFANNETGSISPIQEISKIAHSKSIPFHTDATQMFGKIKIDVNKYGIDALSMSFHKLCGPIGLGMLIIKDKFITGYKLEAMITGTQQFGLRGGTEPVALIAGGVAALIDNFKNRKSKNLKLSKMRNMILDKIEKSGIKIFTYEEYGNMTVAHNIKIKDLESKKEKIINDKTLDIKEPIIQKDLEQKTDTQKLFETERFIVVMGPDRKEKNSYLPNTILLSIVDYRMDFCNVKFKKELEKHGIIVSIGSACNSKSPKASHVLVALKVNRYIKSGILRISMGDNNSLDEIKRFCDIFIKLVKTTQLPSPSKSKK